MPLWMQRNICQKTDNMDSVAYNHILELLHREVKPALGCTEPVAVALAVAKACSLFEGQTPEFVNVAVSANILKNAMGVGIPGTGMVGLHIAVALAVTCGKAEYGLEVLKDLNDEAVAKAKEYVAANKVTITLAKTDKKLYIDVEAIFEGGHRAKSVISDNHDSIVFVQRDNEVIEDYMTGSCAGSEQPAGHTTIDYGIDMKKIYEFACTASLEDISFIKDAASMNMALAKEGLKNEYGLQVGRTILDNVNDKIFGEGLLTHCMSLTAAASDARMAGCTLPAMSNSGSGNQGITVTMPVVAAAQMFGSTEEELIRALILSHLTAIHIKSHLGKLSALCGCVVASTGSSAGIVMLRKGSFDQICYSIKNMIGNITGMVCDGAKVGCALKVASGVSSSVQSALLAMNYRYVTANDGIIDNDIEKSIRNLGTIGSKGMQVTDNMILDIMVNK